MSHFYAGRNPALPPVTSGARDGQDTLGLGNVGQRVSSRLLTETTAQVSRTFPRTYVVFLPDTGALSDIRFERPYFMRTEAWRPGGQYLTYGRADSLPTYIHAPPRHLVHHVGNYAASRPTSRADKR